MNLKSHIITGICLGIYIEHQHYINTPDLMDQIVYYFTIAVSSTLPDIDKTNSWIGRKTFPISWVINKTFSHRGSVHSILFMFIFYFLLKQIIDTHVILIAFLVGYSSHLVADMFTPLGVPLFYPIKRKFSFRHKKRS